MIDRSDNEIKVEQTICQGWTTYLRFDVNDNGNSNVLKLQPLTFSHWTDDHQLQQMMLETHIRKSTICLYTGNCVSDGYSFHSFGIIIDNLRPAWNEELFL